MTDTVPTLYDWCGGSAALHRLSERSGHLEVLLTIILLGAQAWSRARSRS